MRARSPRAAFAAFALLALAAGYALAACSNRQAGGPPIASDVSEASSADGIAPDAPGVIDGSIAEDSSIDATLADGGVDAASGEAGPDDSGGPIDLGFEAGDCAVGPVGEPTDLSCTGLYANWATKTVSPSLKPYAPGLILWSDGAAKARWIYLPPGQKIDTSNMDEWTFPVGTRIWKEFSFPLGDGGAETRIETRLLWKLDADTWYRTTYVWSADGQTSATELTTGELDGGGIGYEIPNQQKCDQCHDGRLDGVLGFEALSLASPAAAGLTMSALTTQGLITDLPDASLAVPGTPIESAALGWLHANCGTACHNNGNGIAGSTGFYMRLDVATLATVQTTDTWTTGWNQQTIGFPIPGVAVSYRLHACDTASSCVYYRADHRTGLNGTPSGTQMPPIDTHKVDDADMAKLAAWINDGCDAGD